MPLLQPKDIVTHKNERESFALNIAKSLLKDVSIYAVCYTLGKYSLIDLVTAFIAELGECEVYVVTYTINNECAEKLCAISNKLHVLADHRQLSHNPDVDEIIKNAGFNIIYSHTHSKITFIKSKTHFVSIAGSANYNYNDRAERIVINANNSTTSLDFNIIKDDFNR